jgi:hypothetical protein
MRARYWCGAAPTHCEVTGALIEDVFYDCETPHMGWACVGRAYFRAAHCQVGIGFGQRYEKQEDGSWLKTAG